VAISALPLLHPIHTVTTAPTTIVILSMYHHYMNNYKYPVLLYSTLHAIPPLLQYKTHYSSYNYTTTTTTTPTNFALPLHYYTHNYKYPVPHYMPYHQHMNNYKYPVLDMTYHHHHCTILLILHYHYYTHNYK
jgi:hypothetical protein